jgi:hypothetical protein
MGADTLLLRQHRQSRDEHGGDEEEGFDLIHIGYLLVNFCRPQFASSRNFTAEPSNGHRHLV